ncbi:LINE-1 retrotransposable element ORF1 protein [Dissostichus eleginoides]|uniref:LINE-1 retrotransposable element ORF1 protein n=1 Tax=Dissostichus eleginoides TaxID=100907 RepID=A0AAD9FPI0_DISEL|nr:LINE-1 retrotransposable element ORF1 protein [Dissostichus eleginoides]
MLSLQLVVFHVHFIINLLGHNTSILTVLKAVRAKKQLLYKDRPVRFYPDLAAGIHKKQKEFDTVRQKLRTMGIRYGMLLPAKLLVTYKDKTQTFENPADVEAFIRRIEEEMPGRTGL